MPNSKRKCKQCKDYFKVEVMQKHPAGWFCSFEHAVEFANKKKEGERLKAISRIYAPNVGRKKGRTNEDTKSNLKTAKEAAKRACHAYIRERDKGDLCICCGERLGDSYQAGHFYESGNYPFIRYDEDNIHAQRLHCNYFKGGDSGFYRENLIKKIGLERVKRLDRVKDRLIKRTAQDYREIESYYKNKLKKLKGSE